jgi:O-acetyl-ADP-ribose deacetylase (regulator of RNase III)
MNEHKSIHSEFPGFETLFVDENPWVINAFAEAFGRSWPDSVRFNVGNIFRSGQGAIVSPTNCLGDLNGGLDLQLQARFDFLEARLQGYLGLLPSRKLKLGTAVWVETGDEEHPFLILAPTFRMPMDMASLNRIYSAAFAVFSSVLAYNAAKHDRPVPRIIMPGFGTGVGDMEPGAAARKVCSAYARALKESANNHNFPTILRHE